MGMYDQLLSVTQQGLDRNNQIAMTSAQQPTMADVFMDRFRQGGQDRLAQQKAAEQTRMNEATMRNMEAQRLIQGAQMMALYGNDGNAPMMQAVGDKIGMPQVPTAPGLKDRELGVKVDQFDKKLGSTEKIASEKNDTAALIASWKTDKKDKPIKLVQVLNHIAAGDIPEGLQADALKWATYTTPPPAQPATLVPVIDRETGQERFLRADREGKGVTPVDPRFAPPPKGAGVGNKKIMEPGKMIDLLNRAEGLLPSATGSLLGTGLAIGKQAVGYSDKKSQTNSTLDTIGAQLTLSTPRLEGPQSDLDRSLYEAAAGKVADKTKPVGDRLAALRELRSIMKQYVKGGKFFGYMGKQALMGQDPGVDGGGPKKGAVVNGKTFKGGDWQKAESWE